jgi:hypothetical protein
MTITISRSHLKVLGVVFTSLVAPVGVHVLTADGPEGPAASPAPEPAFFVADEPACGAATRVVAQGTGSTPAAAFQDALDAALKRSIAAEVSAADWARHGPAFVTAVRQEGKGVVRGWRELSCVPERHLFGKSYRSEVSVEVDVEALRDRLTTGGRKGRP